ncbi:MAG: hypothetical protein AB2A00_20540 [Myxococcota bacterium]
MPFPWLHSQLPTELTKTFKDAALDAYRREVRERAALLHHLGYPREHAVARCRQNLEWEYQLHGKAPILDELNALVDAVYKRA